MFKRYLMHDRLLIRFGTLLGVVMLIFLGTWTVSYVLLPEGLLRGRTAAQVLAIFGSTGLYEIAAYALAATATVSIARYRLIGTWPKQKTSIIPTQTTAVIRERTVGVLLAIALLVAACGWEAFRFSLAVVS